MNQLNNSSVSKSFSAIKQFSESDVIRFWKNVSKQSDNECWNWTASTTKKGYGNFSVKAYPIRAHRFSLAIHTGNFDCEVVSHTCDNPSCVNPNHLKPSTHTENIAERDFKKRQAKGENSGHSKLKKGQIEEIKKLRISGMTLQAIANIFNVDRSNIGYIVNGKTWFHSD